jgi:hypothetical protein
MIFGVVSHRRFVAKVRTAMLAGLRYTGLRDAILAHPVMAKGLGDLSAEVPLSHAKALRKHGIRSSRRRGYGCHSSHFSIERACSDRSVADLITAGFRHVTPWDTRRSAGVKVLAS